MDYSSAILAGTRSLLNKHFSTTDFEASTLDDLQRQTARAVSYLLRHNLSRLLQILYRIDVDEQKVRMVMACQTTDEVADNMAHLIIKRELQKVQTRFMYNRQN
ncbi:hypothetical protein [Pontibacter beigongshangensis]|uniref:hypothetical protein n=1 Tax=Pontibacter beigongshangensis TaxID=2574733 RepID=UPI00164F2CD2|nr:hypothetical protein [Pontibacter beigongshangensis]